MKRLLSLLVLALVGCIPQPSQYPYRVSEVQLLFPEATERWDYFYGEPQALKLGSNGLSLIQGDINHIWAVKNALIVNGEPLWREIGSGTQAIAKTTRVFPGLQYAVRPRKDISQAWIFDGSWSQLGDKFEAGETKLVDTRFGTPTLENLSTAETEVVLREILARRANQPVVIYSLEAPLNLNMFDPSPTRYTAAAIAVQYGIETEVFVPDNQPPKVLQQGGNAAYSQSGAAAFLATNASQLQNIWSLATGNQLPSPALPAVNFAQKRVAAFFWGQKTSGGYSAQYASSQVSGNTLRVTLNLRSPAPGAITTQALTSPFVVLEVPRSVTRVVFVDATGQTLAQASAN